MAGVVAVTLDGARAKSTLPQLRLAGQQPHHQSVFLGQQSIVLVDECTRDECIAAVGGADAAEGDQWGVGGSVPHIRHAATVAIRRRLTQFVLRL